MHWLQPHWRLLIIIDQISVLAAPVFGGVGSIVCDLIDDPEEQVGGSTDHQNNTTQHVNYFCTLAFTNMALTD